MITSLPAPSNILNVSIDPMVIAEGTSKGRLLVSTADRRLSMLVPGSMSCALADSNTHLHQAPILSWVTIGHNYLVTTSMSGQTVLSASGSHEILDTRKDHSKYVVRVAAWIDETKGQTWLATAGWDAKVYVYNPTVPHSTGNTTGKAALNRPVASITLPTNPEALLFLRHPTTSQLILLLSRRDSTFLYYYDLSMLPSLNSMNSSSSLPPTIDASEFPTPELLGRQNLAPYSNAWIAFTLSALAPSPNDPNLLAIATSSVPHMRLIIARLIFPSPSNTSPDPALTSTSTSPPSSTSTTDPVLASATSKQSAAAAETLLREREAAALLLTTSTFAPQTPYSTPALAWRPDGTGVWVNGDDGVVRGVEVASGKVVARLGGLESTAEGEGGHEAGSKVRCLWAGWVDVEEGELDEDGEYMEKGPTRKEEWLVSGGFDQRLLVWRCGEVGE
ncbi:MAG: hypothetical protein Q9157_004356 [Trypethelium eluteriae]